MIEKKCKKNNSRLYLMNRNFSYFIEGLGSWGSRFNYSDNKNFKGIATRMIGMHMVENSSLAIKAIRSMNLSSISIYDIKKGVNDAQISGRLEVISYKPLVLLDGAHNPDKVNALVNSVKQIWPERKIRIVLAIKKDKNAQDMLKKLSEISKDFVLTQYDIKVDYGRIFSYDPYELEAIIKSDKLDIRTTIINDPIEALINIIQTSNKEDIIIATGSLYLLGEIIKSNERQKFKNSVNRGHSYKI
jgi:dihydrofolate synthase/folylpolyglutamate synthase